MATAGPTLLRATLDNNESVTGSFSKLSKHTAALFAESVQTTTSNGGLVVQGLQRFVLTLLSASAVSGVCFAAPPKVAVIVPLTGGLSAVGREIELTSRVSVQQANAKPGAPAIELLVIDDKSNAEGAREAARQALAQGASLIMNCFGSVACMAIAQETKSAGVPLIGAIAGDDRLRGADLPHVFTTRGGARDEIDTILKYLQGVGNKDVAVLYQDDGFGQSYKRTLDSVLTTRTNMRVVAAVPIDPQNKNYAEAAAKAVAQPSTAVILLANNGLGTGSASKLSNTLPLCLPNRCRQQQIMGASHAGSSTFRFDAAFGQRCLGSVLRRADKGGRHRAADRRPVGRRPRNRAHEPRVSATGQCQARRTGDRTSRDRRQVECRWGA